MSSVDFINLMNHALNNQKLPMFGMDKYINYKDRRYKLDLGATTTNGDSITFKFKGREYYFSTLGDRIYFRLCNSTNHYSYDHEQSSLRDLPNSIKFITKD